MNELRMREIAEASMSYIKDIGEMDNFLKEYDLDLKKEEKQYFCIEEDEDEDEDDHVIYAQCSICGRVEQYTLDEEEVDNLVMYYSKGREAGHLQDLFPKVPAWIRAGAIDQYSNGFCICPRCSGQEE